MEVKNGLASFLYSGEINSLLKTLTEKKILQLTIEEPSLEEVFMHYYEEDAAEVSQTGGLRTP